jgi:hypothetical protein
VVNRLRKRGKDISRRKRLQHYQTQNIKQQAIKKEKIQQPENNIHLKQKKLEE